MPVLIPLCLADLPFSWFRLASEHQRIIDNRDVSTLLMFGAYVYRVVRLFYYAILRKEYPGDSIRHKSIGVGDRKHGIPVRVVIYYRNCTSVGYFSTNEWSLVRLQ